MSSKCTDGGVEWEAGPCPKCGSTDRGCWLDGTSHRSSLDAARLARIRARLDGHCAEFDAGIDAILAEIERLRSVRIAIGYLAERMTEDRGQRTELPHQLYVFPNGRVMAFDRFGQQMPKFQGRKEDVLALLDREIPLTETTWAEFQRLTSSA